MTRDPARVQRKPFLTPIWLTVLMGFIGLSILGFATWLWGTADSTTIVVVPQAEKDTTGGADAPLSTAGEARAALLSRMFGDAASAGHLDAIYVTPTRAGRATAAPLAARLGTPPTVASENARHLARRVLREHGGGAVLVVAGADAVTDLVEILSGSKKLAPLGEQQYGTLYIVSVPRIGRPNLLRVGY